MGYGYEHHCKRCNHKYVVVFDIGMAYPSTYQDALEKIASGKYGEVWKELYCNTPLAAIDASEELYVCRTCHTWVNDMDISLYAPNDPTE